MRRFSPLTPRSLSNIQLPVLPVRKLRKMFKLDSVAVHHVCDVGSSAGVSAFIEHDYVSKCVPLPILKRRMIQLFKSCVTFLRVSDQKKPNKWDIITRLRY